MWDSRATCRRWLSTGGRHLCLRAAGRTQVLPILGAAVQRRGRLGPPGACVPPLRSPPSPAPAPQDAGTRREGGLWQPPGRSRVCAAGEAEAEAEAERAREVAATGATSRCCPTWSLRTLPILPPLPSGSPAWIKGISGRVPSPGRVPKRYPCPCPETSAGTVAGSRSPAPGRSCGAAGQRGWGPRAGEGPRSSSQMLAARDPSISGMPPA